MRRALMLSATALALTVSSPAARADDKAEMVENPAYKNWSAFKPGTTVVQEEKLVFAKEADEGDFHHGRAHEKTITYKLLSVTPEEAVVERTECEKGPNSKTELPSVKITYPAKAEKVRLSSSTSEKAEIEVFKEGEEDIKALDKTIHAKTVEYEDIDEQHAFFHKVWHSDDVPGGLIKELKATKRAGRPLSETILQVTSVKTP